MAGNNFVFVEVFKEKYPMNRCPILYDCPLAIFFRSSASSYKVILSHIQATSKIFSSKQEDLDNINQEDMKKREERILLFKFFKN